MQHRGMKREMFRIFVGYYFLRFRILNCFPVEQEMGKRGDILFQLLKLIILILFEDITITYYNKKG
jgi:hypothetical protein